MIELHRKLLSDTVRNDAFFQALQRVIVPGETTVADIGAGTGFLSFLALRLGAKHATLYEYSEILTIAKRLALSNNIEGCTFISKHSGHVQAKAAVDVLISETLGNYALEENILESIEDAKRFINPKGIIIPGKIQQFVCPVTSDRLMKDVDIWPNIGFGLDFQDARVISLNNMYVKTVLPSDVSKERIREWDTIDFSLKNKSIRTGTSRWKGPCTVYGLALWWDAELVKGVHLSTSPFEKPTHWEQIFLPLLRPLKISAGETLEVILHSDTRPSVKINLVWEYRHLDRSGALKESQKLDMKKGYVY